MATKTTANVRLAVAVALRAAIVAHEREDETGPHGQVVEAAYAQDEPDEPVAYLPLALYTSGHGPYWSGTARSGFDAAAHPAEAYDVSLLHADWYLQYPGFRSDPGPEELEYAQIVRLNEEFEPPGPTGDCTLRPGLPWHAVDDWQRARRPGSRLRHSLGVRGDISRPLLLIKAADPTAKVAIGGVVQATPLRLRYLDQILEEYETRYGSKIPVDVWNVHGFILQEKANDYGCQVPCGLSAQQGMLYEIDDHDSMTIFKQQIVRFRQWMKDHGERNKPLIVSEYGILFPIQLGYDEPRVERFMIATFDYFTTATSNSLGCPGDGNKLVQAWAWYSLDHEYFQGYESYSHLFDPDTKQITPLGIAYGNYAASH